MKTQSFLRNRSFFGLFIVQFLSAMNSNCVKTTLLFYLTYIAIGNNDWMVATGTGLFILPFFIFSAIAGQVADKFNKAIVLKMTKLYGLIVIIIFCVAYIYHYKMLLMILLFFVGIESTFIGPIKYSILPEIVTEQKLLFANSIIESMTFIAVLLGTLIPGATLDFEHGYYITITILISAASIGFFASLLVNTQVNGNYAITINTNFIKSTKTLIDYCLDDKYMWQIIMMISWFWAIGIVLLTEIVPFVKGSLHGSQPVASFMLLLFSVGICIGAYVCAFLARYLSRYSIVMLGSIMMTFSFISLGISTQLFPTIKNNMTLSLLAYLHIPVSWFIILATLFIGIFGGLYTIPLYTAMQHHKDRQFLSRVVSVNNIMNAAFMVGGSAFIYVINITALPYSIMYGLIGILNLVYLFTVTKGLKQCFAYLCL